MGRTLLITGASSGIGLGLARAALQAGHRVLAVQRRSSPLAGQPHFTQAQHDLSCFEQTPQVLTGLLSEVDALDQVVLNAGVLGEIRDLGDTPLSELRRVMDVNTWSNKVLLDALFASGKPVGQVIGMSSGAAVSGSRGWGAYALSKATLLMLLKLYAAERPETHFCSLAPGLVDTAMQDVLCSKSAEEVERFPSLSRIQAARGTETMPKPDAVAERLLAAMDQVKQQPSGSFVDIRTM